MADFNLVEVIRLLDKATGSGVKIAFQNHQLSIQMHKDRPLDPAFLNELKTYKSQLIAYFTQQQRTTRIPALPALVAGNLPAGDTTPLSFSQERLWFVDQLEGSAQYHIPGVLRLKGNLNPQALQVALQSIINRHQVLRTVMQQQGGLPYQQVLQPDSWTLALSNEPALRSPEALQSRIAQLIQEPFDLAHDHPLRANLLALGKEEYVLVVVLHHVAADGWSMPVLVRELVEFYRAFVEKRAAQLPTLALQYADFAIWQRQYLQGEILSHSLAYWQEKLKDLAPFPLPTDFPRLAQPSTRGAAVYGLIKANLTQQLQELSQEQGATLFMTLLAAFKVVLHRYTGQPDIYVGSPTAGRQQQEVEGLIGFFINTLVLRTQVVGEWTFNHLLQQVKQTTLEAYHHQQVPFEKVVEVVGAERDRSRNPLFDVKFALHNVPDMGEINLGPEVQLTLETLDQSIAQLDISLDITQSAQGLHLGLTYCRDLYREETMRRMLGHFQQVLEGLTRDPFLPIQAIPILTPAEKTQLLEVFNTTAEVAVPDQTITALFDAQVAQTPDAVALLFENQVLTYRQLNERANQLAHYLQNLGVKEETLVPICLERGLDMLISLWAVLKAGGAYVPLDPDYPQERIAFMLTDTEASVVISNHASRSKLPTETFGSVLILEEVWPLIQAHPVYSPAPSLTPAHLAYVIYTSGSTGQPKGVMVEHRGVVNLSHSQVQPLGLRPGISVLQFASLSFDASCYEIFCTLLQGGRLVLATKETLMDPQAFRQLLQRHQVELVTLPPSYQAVLRGEGLGVKTVVSAGEMLHASLTSELQYQGIRVINAYGPTENTVCATVSESPLLADGTITIGQPIAHVRVDILDQSNGLMPIGLVGEICLGGTQVARGYWHRPELTAEKFIPHPFLPGERLYKTGDIGRWLPDGQIEYLGRFDDQVKMRGYRIELGEIERVLEQHEAIEQAVVLAPVNQGGDQRLIAYVVATTTDTDAWRTYLERTLPSYMVPTHFVALPTFPLTTSGKIDKKALPPPEAGEGVPSEIMAPRTPREAKLVELWKELLEVERVGIHDNFFELGGHSLLAIRFVSAIRRELGISLAIADVFTYPTVAELSDFLTNAEASSSLAIFAQERPDYVPLSFSQERLWFLDQLEGSVAYHIPAVLQLAGELHVSALASALQEVVNRHEVLRTVLDQHDGKPYQRVLGQGKWQLEHAKDVVFRPGSAALQTKVKDILSRPFDVSSDHLLRACLLPLDDQTHWLVVVQHHLISDGWSVPILVGELAELYNAAIENRPIDLAALPLQYADYALWQRQYLQGEVLAEQLAYWQGQLTGVEALQLPADFARPASASTRGAAMAFSLAPSMSASLQALSRQEGSTLFMTLLAAFQVLLSRYSGQTDICVGSAIANREQPEVEGLIGFFANALALRSDLSGNPSFIRFLQRVRQTTLEAYEHQQVPFEKVVDAVVQQRDRSRSPLFQVMFDLQNKMKVEVESSLVGLKLTQQPITHTTARFDLTFTMVETAEGLVGSVEYATDLFLPATIERMVEHFRHLLQAIVANPHQPVSQLDFLPAGERRLLLEDFQGKVVARDPTQTVLSRFAHQVARTPDSVALVFEGQRLRFAQLDEAANRLALLLVEQGVGAETLVPLLLEPGFEQVLAVLGVWKAGGAYVPIDPATPAGRLHFLLQDTGAHVLLTTAASRPAQELPDSVTILELDRMDLIHSQGFVDADSSPASFPVVEPQQLAYVLYTSGSTGEPKGVMIQHDSLCHYLTNHQTHYLTPASDESGRERIGGGSYQLLSYGFDASLTSSWLPLLAGQPLVLAPSSGSALFEAPALAQNAPYGFLKLTPAHLPLLALAQAAPFTSRLVVGGEALLSSQLQALAEVGTELEIINEYGPTEATVGVTTYRFRLSQLESLPSRLPIGKPLDNTQLYLLDSQQQPVPIGVIGEICLGGVSLARGYWNRPQLTSEKFIPHPFSQEPTARLYRTGDLGRWLPDGTLLYEGRLDEQVKLRGYRIEPGEIEAVLVQSGRVEQAVVVSQASGENSAQLLAYVVAKGEWDPEGVQAYLAEHLPSYLLPSQLVVLPQLPLTTNGKIDKGALPLPQASSSSGSDHQAPSTEVQTVLAGIWQELLGVEQVGMHDNFFALGGDSIITIQVVSRARRAGVELQVGDLFEHQTIEKLSAVLAGRKQAEALVGEQGRLSGPSGLLPIQRWYEQKGAPQPQHFNQSVLLGIDKAIATAQLQEIVAVLVAQHDALRFAYQPTESGWQQSYGEANIQLVVEQLTEHPQQSLAQLIEERANAYQRSLDLEKGELCRIVLFQTPDSESHHRLLFLVHHLVIDGVSWRILLEELSQLLEQQRKGQPLSLGAKSSSYRQWQAALEAYGQSERALSQLPYWQAVVKAAQPLPVDESYSSGLTLADTARYSGKLPAELTQVLLQQVPAVYHTEVNDLLLAALAQTLGEWSGQSPVVIGLEGHGRQPDLVEGVDLSRTLGWFTSLYPVRLPVASSPGELIASVKETLRQVPDKGMAYGVLTELNKEKSLQGAAPWEVVFNYLGQFDQVLSSGKGELIGASESTGQNSAGSYPVAEKLSITSLVQGGELLVEWVYSGRHYQPETVQELAQAYLANLQNLIAHCQQLTQPVFTPADYGLSREVSFSELDAFLSETESDNIMDF